MTRIAAVAAVAASMPSATGLVAPWLSVATGDGSALFMAQQTPPQPRMPRRMLKKRVPREGGDRKRNRRNHRHAGGGFPMAGPIGTIVPPDDVVITAGSGGGDDRRKAGPRATQEYRPLVASVRRDMGEDYWIDPEDMERERRRQKDLERQRMAFEARSAGGGGGMPPENLMTEVKAPYRQNWIGCFSLGVATLSIIVAQFPELLEPSAITRFPDL